jgi:uncharacterized protein YeaO (DUF488 family)
MIVQIKRVYEDFSVADGKRILIDRLWPRGLTKEEAHIEVWLKDIAPSTELRQWFDHDPKKWNEFKRRYRKEIEDDRVSVLFLMNQMRKGTVTLVYGARDIKHNDAMVLKEYLEQLSTIPKIRN